MSIAHHINKVLCTLNGIGTCNFLYTLFYIHKILARSTLSKPLIEWSTVAQQQVLRWSLFYLSNTLRFYVGNSWIQLQAMLPNVSLEHCSPQMLAQCFLSGRNVLNRSIFWSVLDSPAFIDGFCLAGRVINKKK